MPAYRSTSFETPGQSVFIATPAYESVKAGYALSLARTIAELTRRHIPHTLNILYGNCHVDDGRNELVRDFLDNTQCTDLVFIDADLMWEPDAFLKLIRHDVKDVVAGAYPFKSNEGTFPVGKILGGIEGGKGKEALLSVSYAPTGFMRIPRVVFERLSPEGEDGRKLHPSRRFFQRRYTDRTYDGGDVTFCRKWIAAGGTVYIDPALPLAHIGENIWRGNFQKYLNVPENAALHTTDSKDPVPDYKPDEDDVPRERNMDVLGVRRAIDKIRAGDTSQEAFIALANAYGNKPWAATADFLYIMHGMASAMPRGANILECGTGLSTIVLAMVAKQKGLKVTSCETDHLWAKCTQQFLDACGLDSRILVAPIEGDWYSEALKEKLHGLSADLLVIDGPRRDKDVKRDWPISTEAIEKGVTKPDAAVIWDDLRTISGRGEWVDCGTDDRPFKAGRINVSKAA